MSVLIKNMEMPKGCIYANDNDQTEYCPLLNHDDVPFCQYIESEPEIAIGIDERPVYCPLSDVPEPCENTVSRQAAIDAAMQYCPDDDGSCSKADRDIRELLDDIENLPSTQTEIIRCRKCKFASGDSRICMKFGHSPIGELDFCAWAERRIDETD